MWLESLQGSKTPEGQESKLIENFITTNEWAVLELQLLPFNNYYKY